MRRPNILALAFAVLSCCCSPSIASPTKPSRSEVYGGVGYDIFDRKSCHGTKHIYHPRGTGAISIYKRKTLEQCALLCNGKTSCMAIFWTSSKCYLQSSTCAKKVSGLLGWFRWWKFVWAEKQPTSKPTVAPTAAPTTLAPTEGKSVIRALPRDYRRVTLGGTDYYPFLFAKTLAHSGEHLMPTVDAVESVIEAVDSTEDGEWKRLLKAIRQHPETARTLEGVQSGRGRTGVATAETATLRAHELPAVDSVEHLCQQIEIYWQSLLRDVPFSEYPTSPQVKTAVSEINKCVAKRVWRGPVTAGKRPKVSPGTLFRGIGSGELEGPYVSQFLLNDFTYGGLLVEQKYLVEADVPPSVTAKGWLNMQHGISNTGNLEPNTERTRTVNGRVIGSEVHMDAVFQFYYNAAMQIVQFPELELEDGWGKDVMHAGLKSSAWSDGGVPDLFVSIAEVSIGALRHAWWNKWQGTMQIRPEVYAARLDQMKTGSAAGQELRKISDDAFLRALDEAFEPTFNAIAEANKLLASSVTDSEQGPVSASELGGFRPYFLAMLYGEGSPTHPSYPAGHAVVAGACITVLKAFSRTHTFKNGQYRRVKWEREAVEATSSQKLASLGTVRSMTVIGELNKLGSNVALARDFAGVHYRSDSDFGIELGETYALEFLRSQLLEYASPHMDDRRFLVELYNGTLVEISRQGVEQKKVPVV